MSAPIAIAIVQATREALNDVWESLSDADRAAIARAAEIAAEAAFARMSGQPLSPYLEAQLNAHAANLASIASGRARKALFTAARSLLGSAATLFAG
jgi:hypothetical protein